MTLIHTLYEPEGRGPHPTILALHGWGASALDLLGLAPLLAGGQFLVLCPQGPVEVPLGGATGYGWFPITMGAPPDPNAFGEAIESLRDFLATAQQRYPIDARKLVALGFSQGGVLAYALALREPARFAALAALSSWLPAALAQQFAPVSPDQLPTLVQHGSADQMIDVGRARESVEALRRLGVSLTYREYDMGHEINPRSLRDLSAWLHDKVISPIMLA
ncbi:MAG TPA: alpha/beta fold hydrolase [Candidatus Kryptonia bacterium]|nr:alpha/beta fold hydrolase [Candidatus Kryptonia bacterium]